MDTPRFAELAEYPVRISLPIQWGDQDAFGHVNNTVFFRWFESVRIAYLDRLQLGDKDSPEQLGPILAAVSCNYRRQLKFPDTVHLGARVTRIGRSSLQMGYLLVSEQQAAVAADGDSTIVAFDYAANRPRPVPDRVREAIAEIEGAAR